MGRKFDDFSFTTSVLRAPFVIKNGQVHIDESKLRLYFTMPKTIIRGHEVALSSLHFDPKRNSLYLLMSYEEEVKNINLGGFLFRLPLEAIQEDVTALSVKPFLIYQDLKEILHFGHKPESVALLDEDTLLVFHDDDRVLKQVDAQFPNRNFEKQPEEAAYTIIGLSATPPPD